MSAVAVRASKAEPVMLTFGSSPNVRGGTGAQWKAQWGKEVPHHRAIPSTAMAHHGASGDPELRDAQCASLPQGASTSEESVGESAGPGRGGADLDGPEGARAALSGTEGSVPTPTRGSGGADPEHPEGARAAFSGPDGPARTLTQGPPRQATQERAAASTSCLLYTSPSPRD